MWVRFPREVFENLKNFYYNIFMKMKEMILKTLEEHEALVRKIYPDATVLGTFLYGSQNYKIDTPESDIDTITILVPSFSDLIFKEPISKQLIMPAGTHEHCVVKDIRKIIEQWKKQSLNFLEILFTDYYIINPIFQEEWNEILKEREFIARMDLDKAIKAIYGQAKNTYLQNKADKKKQANALRMFFFLQDLVSWKPYKDCMTSHHELVYKVKTGECENPYKEDFIYQLNMFTDKYTGSGFLFLPDRETMNFLDTMLYEIIKKNALPELNKEV